MEEREKIARRVRLEKYLEEYSFSDSSRIQKKDGKVYLPAVYCHNGHNLMVRAVTFDGLPAIHVRGLVGGEGGPAEDFYLSPIVNDPRKEGPDLPVGTRLLLVCPICSEPLRTLVPCTCRVGAYRRALYLTPRPDDLGTVGLCEIFGCPQSFVSDDGELVFEVVAEK